MTPLGELRLGNVLGLLQIHQGQADNTDNILQLCAEGGTIENASGDA